MLKKLSVWLILLAGCFWGSMGIFVRILQQEYGFTSIQIAAARLTIAAIGFWIVLLVLRPKETKIKLKDTPLFLALGWFSMAGMCVSYFYAITLSTMSVAAILLYLSPIAVMLMSAIFLKEKITPKKIVALVLAVGGCALVAGLGSGGSVGALAIIVGLISAITYGSYSIFSAKALKKYNPLTVTAYTFTLAAIPVVLLCRPDELYRIMAANMSVKLVLLTVGLAITSAVIPFGIYTIGLKYTPASKAAVLACSSPVSATIYGLIFFHEYPSPLAYAGIVLVLAAIILLNINIGKKRTPPDGEK